MSTLESSVVYPTSPIYSSKVAIRADMGKNGETFRFSPVAPVGTCLRSVNFSPSYFSSRKGTPHLIALLVMVCSLDGCTPTINLATPDPVKVDVSVRLDVYQKTAPTKAKEEQSSLEIAANRRQRSGEIQQLKNNGMIGEDRDGYLDARPSTADAEYLHYADGVIKNENADRAFLYLSNAQVQNKPLEMIESDYAQLWRDRAFPGEWIQKENGTWIRK